MSKDETEGRNGKTPGDHLVQDQNSGGRKRSEAVCGGTKGQEVSTKRKRWASQSQPGRSLVRTPPPSPLPHPHPGFVVWTLRLGEWGRWLPRRRPAALLAPSVYQLVKEGASRRAGGRVLQRIPKWLGHSRCEPRAPAALAVVVGAGAGGHVPTGLPFPASLLLRLRTPF